MTCRTRSFRALALTTLLAALLACATSPTGRKQLMLVSEDMAISASKEAYAAEIGKFQQEGKISTDKALNDRVQRITRRLVEQAKVMRPSSSDWEWSVVVIDDPEVVNAWCMAGGRMAIYTGLIQKIKPSDDEIAQIMGHEIAHALSNHTAEQMSIALATQVGVMAAGVAADKPAIAMTGTAMAAALAIQLPNSRTAETEADRIGIELAAKAGFHPKAAVTLWEKMGQLGGSRPPEFLSTHPDPANRLQRLAGLVPEMMPYYQQANTP
ncbi:MAG: M48 family peptidase [Gammaproteobacteria bacterium]|nr:MAG: M48 family peptidase [Gammaproteobacteria bacterium]